MKANDVKTGMTGIQRDGTRIIFFNDGMILTYSFINGVTHGSYNDGLTHKYITGEGKKSNYDVMKVYSTNRAYEMLRFNESNLIWQREEVKEYTMEEAIEKMGHEFKIKK